MQCADVLVRKDQQQEIGEEGSGQPRRGRDGSALGVLRCFACLVQADFLALNFA